MVPLSVFSFFKCFVLQVTGSDLRRRPTGGEEMVSSSVPDTCIPSFGRFPSF